MSSTTLLKIINVSINWNCLQEIIIHLIFRGILGRQHNSFQITVLYIYFNDAEHLQQAIISRFQMIYVNWIECTIGIKRYISFTKL